MSRSSCTGVELSMWCTAIASGVIGSLGCRIRTFRCDRIKCNRNRLGEEMVRQEAFGLGDFSVTFRPRSRDVEQLSFVGVRTAAGESSSSRILPKSLRKMPANSRLR